MTSYTSYCDRLRTFLALGYNLGEFLGTDTTETCINVFPLLLRRICRTALLMSVTFTVGHTDCALEVLIGGEGERSNTVKASALAHLRHLLYLTNSRLLAILL